MYYMPKFSRDTASFINFQYQQQGKFQSLSKIESHPMEFKAQKLVYLIDMLREFLQQIKKQKRMSQKTSKWSIQEEKLLKQLREEQMNRNQVNWEVIAFALNEKFTHSVRTSKQCRQKYVNHARLYNDNILFDWTKDEFETLFVLYEKYGPCWAFLSTKLINKSQNSIKNKFNNSLRKASKILYHKEGELYKHTKKSITIDMLTSMIDFVNEIQKSIKENGFTVNKNSRFFFFRSQLLRLCKESQSFSNQQITDLVRLIKSLNCKIRSFGIFKSKKRKSWSLTRQGLLSVCQFDNAVNEQLSIPPRKLEQQFKQASDEQKNMMNLSSSTLQKSKSLEGLPLLYINIQDFMNDVTPLKEINYFDKQVCQILGEQIHFGEVDTSLIF